MKPDDGNVFSWGLGSYGQLGTEELSKSQNFPKKISLKGLEKTNNHNNKLNWLLHPSNILKLENSIRMVLSFESSFIMITVPENLKLISFMENDSQRYGLVEKNETSENSGVDLNTTTISSQEKNDNSFI